MNKSLVVVSHVQHYQWQGRLWALGPYVREIDIWADIFPEVVICSPCKNDKPTGDCLPFSRSNISINPVFLKGGGKGLRNKAAQILSLPSVVWKLSRAMKRAWAIHVRLPGNLGMIGAVLAPIFSRRIIAKYAGTWPEFDGESFSYQLQKKILRSKWFKGPVTVYGRWPNQPNHIVPFFTSILTDEQINLAKISATNRLPHQPARILFVGRFDKGKNAHILISALDELRKNGIAFEAHIVGDGTERDNLHQQVKDMRMQESVYFTGAIPFNEVLDQYSWADFLVLTSENAEGWPKAIAEGMAFGLVCFGSTRGLIPQMLENGRGIVIDPITPQNLADGLKTVIEDQAKYFEISEKASKWSHNYSLDGLKISLINLLNSQWHADLYDLNPQANQRSDG